MATLTPRTTSEPPRLAIVRDSDNAEDMAATRDRAYYRIRYPIGERPSLVVAGRSREVIDVAEYGLRFFLGGRDQIEVGNRLRGTLKIGDRQTLAVDGEIVWKDSESAAVQLRDPIPLKVILDEQLYLRSRYKLRDL